MAGYKKIGKKFEARVIVPKIEKIVVLIYVKKILNFSCTYYFEYQAPYLRGEASLELNVKLTREKILKS